MSHPSIIEALAAEHIRELHAAASRSEHPAGPVQGRRAAAVPGAGRQGRSRWR
jgi:hypothetical protein